MIIVVDVSIDLQPWKPVFNLEKCIGDVALYPSPVRGNLGVSVELNL